MTFIEYYIYINIYLMFIFLFFRLFLSKEKNFVLNRYFILSMPILIMTIPFINELLDPWLKMDSNTKEIAIKWVQTVLIPLSENISHEIKPETIQRPTPGILIISGSILMFIVLLIQQIKLMGFIGKANKESFKSCYIIETDKYPIPFIYNNNIVIPDKIPEDEKQIVVQHEYLHYSLWHHYDHYIMNCLQAIFWANPFLYFLKRDLKQQHEFQVDHAMISSDIDVQTYKLTLIKYSVGYQMFALANGLACINIKKRLIMMNKHKIRKNLWKYYFIVPLLGLFLAISGFSEYGENIAQETEKTELVTHTDSKNIEHLTIYDIPVNKMREDNSNWIRILMNKNNEFLLEDKLASIDNISEKVYSIYKGALDEELSTVTWSKSSQFESKIKISIHKDIGSSMDVYKQLTGNVFTVLSNLRNDYCLKLYKKTYNSLSDVEKEQFDKIIPLTIYQVTPNKIMGK